MHHRQHPAARQPLVGGVGELRAFHGRHGLGCLAGHEGTTSTFPIRRNVGMMKLRPRWRHVLGYGSAKSRLSNVLPWLIVAVCIAAGYRAMRPPAPRLPDSAIEFSAQRAFEHVRAIALEPHPMGTAANAEVRRYIVAALDELGVEVELQTSVAPDFFGNGEPVDVVNVIGRIPGAASTAAIALVGHYDTVPTTAGANDNSSAVAALLETARALLAGPPLDNDLLLVFTDGEEPSPRYGSSAFVARAAAFRDIGLVVNFEALGGSGASILVETNGSEAWLIGELAKIDSPPGAFSFLTETTRLLGDIGTDFDQFRNAGTHGMHFAYLHGSPIYHTAADNLDAVDLGSLQHHGEHALGIARRFGFHDFGESSPQGSVVFFPFGSFFLHYPATWAIPLMLIAVAGLWGGIVRNYHRVRALTEIRHTVALLASALSSAVLATIIWLLIAAARPTLGLVEGYLYFVSLVAAAVGGMLWVTSRTGVLTIGKHSPTLLWLALTVLTAFLGVGFSYLFVWPALAAAACLWWKPAGDVQRMLGFALIAAVTLLLAIPAIDVFLQLAFPRPGNLDSSIPAVALVPLLLALLVAGWLRAFWPTRRAH